MINSKKSRNNICVIGAGFIGMALIKSLICLNFDIRVIDRNNCPDELKQYVDWRQGSINDVEFLKEALKDIDIVYHLIATTVPTDFNIDQVKELNENVVSMLDFIQACVGLNIKRIIFSSSSSVYGRQSTIPILEDAVTNPISTHGINKLMIEKYLLLAEYLHGVDIKILRISNPYGPGQNVNGRQGFIAMALGNIMRNTSVTLRGDGNIVRDFVFIDDVVEALISVCIISSSYPIFNIGYGMGATLKEVLEGLGSIIGKPVGIKYEPSIPTDIQSSILDISLATREIGYSPRVELIEGLQRTCSHHGLLSAC